MCRDSDKVYGNDYLKNVLANITASNCPTCHQIRNVTTEPIIQSCDDIFEGNRYPKNSNHSQEYT
ncbi:hypothetical protein ADLECEL_20010 [Adlercreutzia equolifaciens subsp. celatus]|nr:hypothetical protein ADLECEL_20010 [Adlercreutzia equolifaciens subsp. celatus]